MVAAVRRRVDGVLAAIRFLAPPATPMRPAARSWPLRALSTTGLVATLPAAMADALVPRIFGAFLAARLIAALTSAVGSTVDRWKKSAPRAAILGTELAAAV